MFLHCKERVKNIQYSINSPSVVKPALNQFGTYYGTCIDFQFKFLYKKYSSIRCLWEHISTSLPQTLLFSGSGSTSMKIWHSLEHIISRYNVFDRNLMGSFSVLKYIRNQSSLLNCPELINMTHLMQALKMLIKWHYGHASCLKCHRFSPNHNLNHWHCFPLHVTINLFHLSSIQIQKYVQPPRPRDSDLTRTTWLSSWTVFRFTQGNKKTYQ